MKNKTINKIMKKILVFIIALMSFNSIAQTKIYNQPVKYRITPNLSVVDSILTKSSSDLLTATSVDDFKTQIGLDSYVLKTGDIMTGNLTAPAFIGDGASLTNVDALTVQGDSNETLRFNPQITFNNQNGNDFTNFVKRGHYFGFISGGTNYPNSTGQLVTWNQQATVGASQRLFQIFSDMVSDEWYLRRIHQNTSSGFHKILHTGNFGKTEIDALGIDAATLNGQTTFSTDLSYTASPTQGTVNSSTGTDAVIPTVTGTNAGLQKPDFYDEGSGSVTLSGGSYTLGSATYYYVRNGNNVALSIDIQNINGTGSGQLAIGSLPYNPSASGFHVSSVNLFSGSTYGTPVDLRANLNSGSNTIRFNTITSTAYASSIDFTSGRIRLDITYRVNVYTP